MGPGVRARAYGTGGGASLHYVTSLMRMRTRALYKWAPAAPRAGAGSRISAGQRFAGTVMAEPWKRSGLVKGIGIPAPSGQHPVGCVDLMHQARSSLNVLIVNSGEVHEFSVIYLPLPQFEGDDHGGLLVRLFYPADLGPTSPSSLRPAQFALWTPDSHYTKGILYAEKVPAPWLLAPILTVLGKALLFLHQCLQPCKIVFSISNRYISIF